MEGASEHAATGSVGAPLRSLNYHGSLMPIAGESEAVKLATLYRGTKDPIRLRGGFCVITPGWAKAMLAHGFLSGRIDERDVRVMAEDIANLRWHVTGDAIVIDERGRLIKGRKRLTACIAADVPFVSLILAGVSSDSATVDTAGTGRARLLSDILKIAGFEPHRSLATALPLVWRLRRGTADLGEVSAPGDLALLELLHANPDLRDAMSMAQARERGRIMRLPLFASMVFVLGRANKEKTREFIELLGRDGLAVKEKQPGERLPESHPVRALNDVFLNARAGGRDLDHSLLEAAGTVINVFNAFVTGIPPKAYRWRKEAMTTIPFPRVIGWTQEMDIPLALEGADARRRDWAQAVELAALPSSEFSTATGENGVATESREVPEILVEAIADYPNALSDRVWEAAFRGGMIPTLALEMIDAATAITFLERNSNNRGQKRTVVEKYQRDIGTGTFASLNGQTVKIGEAGRLLDGQHRMQGIAATDARLPFVVVRGLDDEAFEVMDRGRSRAFRTVLEGRGFRNSGILASAARLMWQWERSKFKEVHGVTPSIPELSRIVADHPKLLESLSYSNSLRGLLTPAAACWVEYMLIAKGGQRAEEFLARLSTGEDLRRGNPILVLRKVLTDAHARGKRGRGVDDEQAGQLDLVTQAALTVLAWNKWNDGKTVRFVNWSKAEEFPEVAPAKLGPLGESEVSS